MNPIRAFLTRVTDPVTERVSEPGSASSRKIMHPGFVGGGVLPPAQRSIVDKNPPIALPEPQAPIQKLPVEIIQGIYKELAPKDFIALSQSRLFLSEASKSKRLLGFVVEKSGNRDDLKNLGAKAIYDLLFRSVLLQQQYTTGPSRVIHLTNQSGNTVRPASFSPDSRFLVTVAASEYTAQIWDLNQSQPTSVMLRGHTGLVNFASFSPDGRFVVTASTDGTAKVWDPSQTPPTGLDLQDGFSVDIAFFSPNSRFVLTQSFLPCVRVWDLSQNPPTSVRLGQRATTVSFDAFSADSRFVVTRHRNVPRVWDLRQAPPTSVFLRGQSGNLGLTQFSSNGYVVSAGSKNRIATVWDLNSTPPTAIYLDGHSLGIICVSFSPDRRFVATGSYDHTARVWDLSKTPPTGTQLKGHTSDVCSVSFSADGLFLLTASTDSITKLWDLMQNPPIAIDLRGERTGYPTASFSPDGRFVVTADALRNTTKVWDFRPALPEEASTVQSLRKRLYRLLRSNSHTK